MSLFGNLVLIGTFAERPAASIPGRLFFATDTGLSYRDNGVSWDVYADQFTQDVPSGEISGQNLVFTLSNTPLPAASLMLFLNGLVQRQGVDGDYTLSGNTITFGSAPAAGSTLVAWYRF